MAGSIFINSCIFNHAPVVHTSESQLGNMSGKRRSDFALLLFFQSSGPLILLILFFPPAVCPLVPHVCWPFDKSYGCWNLWPPPVPVVTVEPLSYWPVHHENKKKQLGLFQSGLQGKLLSYLANTNNRILHLRVTDYCNWVESTDGWVEFLF